MVSVSGGGGGAESRRLLTIAGLAPSHQPERRRHRSLQTEPCPREDDVSAGDVRGGTVCPRGMCAEGRCVRGDGVSAEDKGCPRVDGVSAGDVCGDRVFHWRIQGAFRATTPNRPKVVCFPPPPKKDRSVRFFRAFGDFRFQLISVVRRLGVSRKLILDVFVVPNSKILF